MITRFDEFLNKPIKRARVKDFERWVEANDWGLPTISNPSPGNETEKSAHKAIKAYLREVLGLKKHPLLSHKVEHRKGQRRKALTVSEKEAALADVARMTRPRVLVIRNTAFMEMLWWTMVRRNELANLLMENVLIERGFIKVWAKAANKKGKRLQWKKLSPDAKKALREWLEIRPQFNPTCPYVFITRDGGHWTSNSVSSFFKRLDKRLAFKIYSHAYRGGGITWALEQGVPDRLVMKQSGIDSPAVFRGYSETVSLNSYGELLWGER